MKKLKIYIISIIMFVCSIFSIGIKNVYAITHSDRVYIDDSFTFAIATTKIADHSIWIYDEEKMLRRKSDNQLIYCIQAHVLVNDGAIIVGTDIERLQSQMTNLSFADRQKIFLLAYYGYGYGNHTSLDWYAATQIMIWQITDKNDNPPYPVETGDHTLKYSTKYDSMFNEINYLVNHHSDVVSFDGQEVTLNVGETLTLTDTRGVLSKFYEVKSNDYLDLSISNNQLIIKANKPYEGTIELKAKENTNLPYIYEGAGQNMASRGDPTFRYANLKINSLTEFKFNKYLGNSNTGAYKPEQNAKFELYNNETNELIDTLITDEDGFSNIYLRFGTYRLHQIEGEEGYKFISDYIFTVDGTKMKEVMYFNNEIIKSDVVITKKDISTGELLPNAKIGIYKADTDELVFSGITDNDGQIIIKNLEYGDYYILETEAPKGYKINNEKMYFSITKDGEIIKSTIEDEMIETVVEVEDTGKSNIDWGVIRSIILILIGIGFIIYGTKKKK